MNRTLSITIGVASGIIIGSAAIFLGSAYLTKIAMEAGIEEMNKQIEETNKGELERQARQKKEAERKALTAAIQKKESSDECKFWRQQPGTNAKKQQKIEEYCWTGIDQYLKDEKNKNYIKINKIEDINTNY